MGVKLGRWLTVVHIHTNQPVRMKQETLRKYTRLYHDNKTEHKNKEYRKTQNMNFKLF
jgi:hypothetical protein